ncbi:MAG: hypothetical protein HOP17_01035 [Acidobacteria bacterium]|nr:hypothetical protein [Acidobacteriota bacterium]
MKSSETGSYRFKSFLLDAAEQQLTRDGELVQLTPKAFDVLVYLVSHGGHLVHKDELMQSVWPDSFVDEVNIPRTIHTLRRALGEDENGSKFIETVPTKGYRFVAEVDELSEPGAVATGFLQPVAINPVATASGSDLIPDETVTSAKPRQNKRIVLFTVGFACAIALIFLLSFNFQSASSVKSNVKSIDQGQYTTNDEAYRMYLLGSALADKLTPKNAEKAIEAFEQAITLDPNYAPAYAGLANVRNSVAFMGSGGNPTEEYLKARAAVEKALAIDENLAEAHSYSGEMMTNFEWDFVGAEREHKRALELNSNSAAVRRMYALWLGFLGRSDESIAEIKTAIDLEPASVLNHKIYQQNAFYARRYDESIAEGKRLLEMDPEFLGVYDTLIGSYLMKGEDAEAFKWFLHELEQKKSKPDEIESWKTIYAQSGWPGIFERQLEQAKEAERNGNPSPMKLVRLYLKTGKPEKAFVYLGKAFDGRVQGMISLKVSPNYDPLRADPRFDDLIRRVGLK